MHRTLRAIGALIPAAMAACSTESTTPHAGAAIAYVADTTSTAYFGTPESSRDTTWLQFHANTLRAMEEPPLRTARLAGSAFVLRFLWYRSFHPSVAVRVTRSAAGCTITTTVRENDMWQLPPLGDSTVTLVHGERLRRDSTSLAASACTELEARLAASGLESDTPRIKSRGLDGSDWVLERLDARGYAALIRWSPDCASECAVFTTGMAFLRAAHALPARPQELY